MVDGASDWQRITRVTLPLTMRTVLLVTLVSVIGSLLAFDQFFLMTSGQPRNLTATSVFYVYLNSFPYLEAGLRRGAVADPGGDDPVLHHHAVDVDPAEPRVSAGYRRVPSRRVRRGADVRASGPGGKYRTGARVSGAVHVCTPADRVRGARVGQITSRGRRGAADLFSARLEPARVTETVELSARAADLSAQQLRHGVSHHRVGAAA